MASGQSKLAGQYQTNLKGYKDINSIMMHLLNQ